MQGAYGWIKEAHAYARAQREEMDTHAQQEAMEAAAKREANEGRRMKNWVVQSAKRSKRDDWRMKHIDLEDI